MVLDLPQKLIRLSPICFPERTLKSLRSRDRLVLADLGHRDMVAHLLDPETGVAGTEYTRGVLK